MMNRERNHIVSLNAGERILVDTCSLIEGNRYKSIFSKVTCLVLPQTYRELSRVVAKRRELCCNMSTISAETIEESYEVQIEARRLYRKYGLLWGLSYVDCLYIASAKIGDVPLMSCDRALLKVAEKEGVRIIPMHLHGKQMISIVISKVTCENVASISKSEEDKK